MKQHISSVTLASPVYNDMHSMPIVLPYAEKLFRRVFTGSTLLLINDASTDGSEKWLETYVKNKPFIRVITHTKNLGIAKTFQQLYRESTGDIVVLFSLDGEWNPQDAVRLAQKAIAQKYDMVVGVRTRKQYAIGRRVVSTLYNMLTVFIFGVATRDAGSIKAIRRKTMSQIPIRSRGVFDEAERIIRAAKAGYRIGFIEVHHNMKQKTKSGIRLSHMYQAVVDMVRVYIDMRLHG